MMIRFNGFKNDQRRTHLVTEINGRYRKIYIGDVLDEDPKVCFNLMSNTDQVWTQVRQRSTEAAPAGDNRAVLDGKAD